VEVVRWVDIGSVDVALLEIIEKFDNASVHADLIDQALRALSFLYSSNSNDFAEISNGVWLKIFAAHSEANPSMFLNVMKLVNGYFASKKHNSKLKMGFFFRMHYAAIVSGFRKHGQNLDVAQEGRKLIERRNSVKIAIILLTHHSHEVDIARTALSTFRKVSVK
jgi:hypothetical protein